MGVRQKTESILEQKSLVVILLLLALPLFVVLFFDALKYFGIKEVNGATILGRDFVNYYTSSVLVLKSKAHLLFEIANYEVFVKDYFDVSDLQLNWSYPPHYLLLTWPLSFLPYLMALMLWTFVGVFGYYKAVKLYISNQLDAWIITLAPAALLCILAGQNGLLSAALTVAPFALREKHPRLAGILLGCLTYKPQLGVIIPIALILMRDWKVVFWAGLSTMSLFGLSILLFGFQSWLNFFYDIMPLQMTILETMSEPFSLMIPSLFKSARLFGLDYNAAMFCQIIVGLFAVIAVIWAFWRERQYDLQLACLFTSIFLFSPYVVIYDMVPLALAVYLYYRSLKRSYEPIGRLQVYFLLLVVSLPFTTFFLSVIGLPITPLILLVFLGCILYRLRVTQSHPRSRIELSDFKNVF